MKKLLQITRRSSRVSSDETRTNSCEINETNDFAAISDSHQSNNSSDVVPDIASRRQSRGNRNRTVASTTLSRSTKNIDSTSTSDETTVITDESLLSTKKDRAVRRVKVYLKRIFHPSDSTSSDGSSPSKIPSISVTAPRDPIGVTKQQVKPIYESPALAMSHKLTVYIRRTAQGLGLRLLNRNNLAVVVGFAPIYFQNNNYLIGEGSAPPSTTIVDQNIAGKEGENTVAEASLTESCPRTANPIHVGDVILAVNNVDAYSHTFEEIVDALKWRAGRSGHFSDSMDLDGLRMPVAMRVVEDVVVIRLSRAHTGSASTSMPEVNVEASAAISQDVPSQANKSSNKRPLSLVSSSSEIPSTSSPAAQLSSTFVTKIRRTSSSVNIKSGEQSAESLPSSADKNTVASSKKVGEVSFASAYYVESTAPEITKSKQQVTNVLSGARSQTPSLINSKASSRALGLSEHSDIPDVVATNGNAAAKVHAIRPGNIAAPVLNTIAPPGVLRAPLVGVRAVAQQPRFKPQMGRGPSSVTPTA